ncbi:MAG: 50S ribosomal protein L25 [Lachnospiraceae bacterium]|nr:50S ribosomal protein L25 [Lachnospiraceae bacterium]
MDTLKTKNRDLSVKAKKLRREGYVTGSLFGKKIEDSIPLLMEKSDVNKLLKDNNKGSKITLEMEDGKKQMVLIKEIEYEFLKGNAMEISFQALVSDEVVKSVAEIVVEGADDIKEGILQHEISEVSYSALPADLVDKVVLDVSSLKPGDTIHVKDLDIAKNPKLSLHTDLEAVIVTVTVSRKAVEEEPAEEAAAEGEKEEAKAE